MGSFDLPSMTERMSWVNAENKLLILPSGDKSIVEPHLNVNKQEIDEAIAV